MCPQPHEPTDLRTGRPKANPNFYHGDPSPMTKVSWEAGEQSGVQRVFDSGLYCSVYQEATEVEALEKEFAQC